MDVARPYKFIGSLHRIVDRRTSCPNPSGISRGGGPAAWNRRRNLGHRRKIALHVQHLSFLYIVFGPAGNRRFLGSGRPRRDLGHRFRKIVLHAQQRLRPKSKSKEGFPSDPGRKRPKTPDFPKQITVRTLPRTPGGRGDKNKIKNVLKYHWACVCPSCVHLGF